jgi:hypothetical protein
MQGRYFYMMKLLFLALLLHTNTLLAKTDIFRGKENQITIQGGFDIQGSGMNTKVSHTGFKYSQKGNFFKINTRDNIEVLGLFDLRDNTINHTTMGGLGMSRELVFGNDNLYFTAGLGAYIKTGGGQVGSNFMFGERIAIGKHINDRFAVELYATHFSNGYLRTPNDGYNFIGLALTYNF